MTDIDLAGQVETRQSTSGTMHYLNGMLIHWRGRTERLIVHTTAAGKYIALSRGNTMSKNIRDIMVFFGNTTNIYYLYTDNQAAEHITTQPNMNDHSRSIDIRIYDIRQDYLDDAMRIGGVASTDNTSDIFTKNLQPHLHQKHCTQLHMATHSEKYKATNNSLWLTSDSRQEVGAHPEDCNVPHAKQRLPRHMSRAIVREPPLAHPHQTTSQRVNLANRSRQRQQHKPLMRKLVKLLETAHIPLQTHEHHGLNITQSRNDHKNNNATDESTPKCDKKE
jgi:hypothetical protein